jgi:hypothetical protein
MVKVNKFNKVNNIWKSKDKILLVNKYVFEFIKIIILIIYKLYFDFIFVKMKKIIKNVF